MDVAQSLLEKLRPLVGLNSWDYCVLWKLGDDQRFIEWVGCCCGGAGKTQNGGEELLFSVSPLLACRDLMYQHPRTKNCDLLAHLPSSMPLDSGIHAGTLISNQPRWINSDSSLSDETTGTRVLIPISGGLIELFVAKQVNEDPHLLEFVMAHWEQEEPMMMNTSTSFHEPPPSMLGQELDGSNSSSMADGFTVVLDHHHQSNPPNTSSNHHHHHHNHNHNHNFLQQYWVPPSTTSDNNLINLPPWDLSLDQIRNSSNSPMNFFGGFGQQFPPSSTENRLNNDTIFEGSTESILSDKPMMAFDSPGDHHQHGYPEMDAIHHSLMSTSTTTTTNNFHPSIESSVNKDSVKQEKETGLGGADSISDCSEDDGDHKVVGRAAGRGHKSKNLVAERKRRKKLNDRLYALRALVPKITKMDRAAILGDAIEFVKELQKQVKDLQDELEEPPEEDGDKNTGNNNIQLDPEHKESLNGSKMGIIDNGTRCSSNGKISDPSKQCHDTITDDKSQQMEVQVEVTQIDGNGFFLKVFCEQKPGGLVRLMEAMNSLGLEVTNANVTTFRGLVLNVFKVEKRDNEMVQADHVRDSLLELTRNPIGGWSETMQESENYHNHNHHHQTHHINSHHHNHLLSHHLQP